jgi:cell division protein FtsL
MNASPPTRRFVVVPSRPRGRLIGGLTLAAWLVSLAVAWEWSSRTAAPELAQTRREAAALAVRLVEHEQNLEELRQRVATLTRSDEISRAANQQIEQGLAEREEEISQLRADVAFYERLVGVTGQRRGLSVHSVRMQPEAGGAWHYTVTLTQNLNRGKVSKGGLTLQIEGVRAGKLQSLRWPELVQSEGAAEQDFSFRYFQQLEGSVMLPEGFTPHRVRAYVRADGKTIEQAFPWEAVTAADAGAKG